MGCLFQKERQERYHLCASEYLEECDAFASTGPSMAEAVKFAGSEDLQGENAERERGESLNDLQL